MAKFFIEVDIPDQSPWVAPLRTVIGEYHLDPMPGCPKIGISHGLVIYHQYRGKGYATKAHNDRLEQAKRLGYSILLATITESNQAQQHLLTKFHWKQVRMFNNLSTGNDVGLWYNHLTDPYKEYNEIGV